MKSPSTWGALAWVALALSLAAAFTLVPLGVPVIFAAWTAAVARPLLDRLDRTFRGRRTAAAVLVVALVLVVAAASTFLGAAVVSGSGELWALISKSPSAQSALQALVSPGDAGEAPRVPATIADLIPWVQEHSADAFALIGGVAGAAVKSIVGSIIFFFGVWTLLVDGPRAWRWAREHLPLPEAAMQRLGAAFNETGRGLLIGVGLTNACQAVVAVIAYLSLGVPRAVVLGLLTGLAAFIPIGGAAIVWAPVAAGLYLTGHPVKALVMGVFGIVISTMDNVLRPIFARSAKLDLPVYLLFLSVFGGLAAWGPFGAIVGPLIVRLTIEALTLLREQREAEADVSPPAATRLPRAG